MITNGGDNLKIVRALFPYDGDNTGILRVLCPNDNDNTHAIRALMAELIVLNTPFLGRELRQMTKFLTILMVISAGFHLQKGRRLQFARTPFLIVWMLNLCLSHNWTLLIFCR